MNIFLLEDDILQQQRLELVIRDILTKNHWVAKSIIATSRPDFLLEKVRETVDQNIYFLDIELHGEKRKGLEVAKEIRLYDKYGIIIFITTHSEFAPITYAYKVSAFDFIDKESSIDDIQEHIFDGLSHLQTMNAAQRSEELFVFRNQNTSFQVPFSDILYFETTEISHKVRLICKSRLVNFYATLEEIKKLDDRFYKVHRSFVVNLNNITEIKRNEGIIYFDNNHFCPISRRKIKTVLEKINTVHLG